MYRSKQKILLGKEEASYATDPTPTLASNAIDAKDIKINYVGEVLERDLQRESISPVASKLGKRSIEISFTCELKGSGTAGTAPAIGDLLEACGFAESSGHTGGSSSVLYKPASTGHKSITFYLYDVQAETGNYRLHEVNGARGNANIILEAGQIPRIEFSFKGKYVLPIDTADPGNATYESTTPPVVSSSSFSLNSVGTLVIQSVNVDIANEVSERPDLDDATSIAGFMITGRKPNGSFNPEAVLLATYDFWTDWVGATQRALSVVCGATAGNICTITAPKVIIDAISEGDRNGIRTEDIPFRLSLDSGDDELVLSFT